MAMPPGCFGFQYPSKFKLVSSWGSLPWRRIPTDLFVWLVIGVLLLFSRLWTLCVPSSRSQHAPSATSDTLGSITYYSATRVRMSNTHLWWFWRCWSRHKCSTGSFAWACGVVSALFESCCWSEYRNLIPWISIMRLLRESPTLTSLLISFTRSISHLSLAVLVTDRQFWWLLRLKVPIMVVTKTLASVTTGFQIMLPFRHALLTACGSRHFQIILKNLLPSLSPRHGLID